MRYDAMLVLGCGLDEAGQPMRVLISRLEEALRAYKEGLAPAVILCGGYDEHGHNEAQAMREYLLRRGLSGNVLRLERRSVSTRDNLYLARDHVLALGAARLLVITSGFHKLRVLYNARHLHMRVAVRAARAPLCWESVKAALREFAAMGVSLYRFPTRLLGARRGDYRPGRYYRRVELKGKDGNPMHPQVYRLNQSSPVIVTDGVTRRVLARGGRLMLCELHLQKDAQTPKLPAPQELVLCVHTGAALLRTEQGDIELNAGDSAYVPPGGTYGLTALAENTTVGETYTPQVAELLPEF